MKNLICLIISISVLVSSASAADRYVSAAAVAGQGQGTLASPWTLSEAFSGSVTIAAGDTVWIRGGTYSGIFSVSRLGTISSPIVFRNYKDERAVIDGQITLGSSRYLTFWGLEVIDSLKLTRGDPFDTISGGDIGNKFVNCLIHDACNCLGGGPQEAYGNIMWNCGKSSREHGIYWQNDFAQTGLLKTIRDNIIFNSAGFGIHSYSSAGKLDGFLYDGNVLWQNGALLQNYKDNILLGGGQPVNHAEIKNNLLFGPTRGIRVGWSNLTNVQVSLSNNYIAIADSPFIIAQPFQNLVFNNNTIAQRSGALVQNLATSGSYQFSGNTYYSSTTAGTFLLNGSSINFTQWQSAGYDAAGSSILNGAVPVANKIFLKPNLMEGRRFDVVVYNWQKLSKVLVDVSNYLTVGHRYEVRLAENYFNPIVSNALYTGGTIEFPMPSSPAALPSPLGGFSPPPSTLPDFGVFIVIDKGQAVVPDPPRNLKVVP